MAVNSMILTKCEATAQAYLQQKPEFVNLNEKMFTQIEGVESTLKTFRRFPFGTIRMAGGFKFGDECSQMDSGRNIPIGDFNESDIIPFSKTMCLTDKQQNELTMLYDLQEAGGSGYSQDLFTMGLVFEEWFQARCQICTLGSTFLNPEIAGSKNLYGLVNLPNRTVLTGAGNTIDFTKTGDQIQDVIADLTGASYSVTGNELYYPDIMVLPSTVLGKLNRAFGNARMQTLRVYIKEQLNLEIIGNPYLTNKGFIYRKSMLFEASYKNPEVKTIDQGMHFVFDFLGYTAGIATAFPEMVVEFPVVSS